MILIPCPFYEQFKGDDGEWWELYRIAVTGSVHTVAWLKVREVTLGGYHRFNVYQHRMHAETRIVRVEMAPDQPEYWDVVQKNRKMDHALLSHIQPNLGYDLPSGEQRFEVVASARQGASVTKLVVVTIDVEKKLHAASMRFYFPREAVKEIEPAQIPINVIKYLQFQP